MCLKEMEPTLKFWHRFLTQTRPDVPNPEIYHMTSPLQTQTQPDISLNSQTPAQVWAAATQSLPQPQASQRQPLGTISLSTDDLEQGYSRPLRRLKKRDISPAGFCSSPFPSPKTNAFEIITYNAKVQATKKKKPEKSEFIEGEAEESDDDEMHGFGGFGKAKGDGEEEGDGEDLDKMLEELVDDKEMNEKEVARQAVLEKHQYVLSA
jgi:mediator of replication checkpoint protein 1